MVFNFIAFSGIYQPRGSRKCSPGYTLYQYFIGYSLSNIAVYFGVRGNNFDVCENISKA